MKASKFTDAQKAFILRQGDDDTPVEEIFRKAGISQATYFNWKGKYPNISFVTKLARFGSTRQQKRNGGLCAHLRRRQNMVIDHAPLPKPAHDCQTQNKATSTRDGLLNLLSVDTDSIAL